MPLDLKRTKEMELSWRLLSFFWVFSYAAKLCNCHGHFNTKVEMHIANYIYYPGMENYENFNSISNQDKHELFSAKCCHPSKLSQTKQVSENWDSDISSIREIDNHFKKEEYHRKLTFFSILSGLILGCNAWGEIDFHRCICLFQHSISYV